MARMAKLPRGTRNLTGSRFVPSRIGLMDVPTLAPRTMASVASGLAMPVAAREMMVSTTATLEWAAQAKSAANARLRIGSPVIAVRISRAARDSSAGLNGGAEEVQGKQHQAEADGDATEVVNARGAAATKGDEARRRSESERECYVEGQHLDDQCRADIGAEHDRQTPSLNPSSPVAASDVVMSAVAVLDCRAAVTPSRQQSAQTRRQAVGEDSPKVGAERAHDACLHHVDAPQEQADLADDVDQYARSPTCRYPSSGGHLPFAFQVGDHRNVTIRPIGIQIAANLVDFMVSYFREVFRFRRPRPAIAATARPIATDRWS